MSRAPLPTTAMTTMTTTMTATMPTTPPTARGRARGERHETYIEHRLTTAALTSGHVAAALAAAPLHVRLTARSRCRGTSPMMIEDGGQSQLQLAGQRRCPREGEGGGGDVRGGRGGSAVGSAIAISRVLQSPDWGVGLFASSVRWR